MQDLPDDYGDVRGEMLPELTKPCLNCGGPVDMRKPHGRQGRLTAEGLAVKGEWDALHLPFCPPEELL